MPQTTPLRFGEFLLDVANARLTRGAQVLEMPPKSFALLTLLAQRPGELVVKDELLDSVWGRRFVSEGAVKTVVSELRATLGDDARAPRWIETVQGRGYRFLGQVERQPPAEAAATDRGRLPQLLPRLIGRAAESAALRSLLAERRLVTITGAAGVGKSLLALTVAGEGAPADGVWPIELSSLAGEASAVTLRATIAQALQLADASAASDAALVQALRGLPRLLVFDNAEALLELLAPVVSALAAQLPDLRLLVTSREPLKVPQEQVFRLEPLALPAADSASEPAQLLAAGAVAMLVERIQARQSDFVLDAGHAASIVQLARSLDGLPLALELAAARVTTLGLQGLAEQLAPASAGSDPRLQLLTQGARNAAPHQRTLRATVDWSHALLTSVEQQVFRRLAVFRGGFNVASALLVAGDDAIDEWAVLDALDALVAKSMLGAPGAAAAPMQPHRRFTQLECLRAYAHERLVEADELAPAQRRHFDAALEYWSQADTRALGDPALEWVQRHGAEIDNLRAALRWSCRRLAESPDARLRRDLMALAGHGGLLWHRAGHALEGLRWCQEVLAIAGDDAEPAQRAGIDLALAHLAGIAMVLPAVQGLAAARRAVAAFAETGDAVRAAYARYLEHTLMCRAEPLADRGECLARLQSLVAPDWSDMLKRFARSAAAYEARLQGRHAEYLAFNQQELARCRAIGAVWETWSAAIGVMLAEHDIGHHAEAIAVGREVLAQIRSAGRLRQNANRLAIWNMMLAQSGDTAATREALREAMPIVRSAGRGGMLLLPLAWLSHHERSPQTAALLLARFDSPQRTGGEFGPGTYIRRSMDELWQHLTGELGAAEVQAQRVAAEALGDEAVVHLTGID